MLYLRGACVILVGRNNGLGDLNKKKYTRELTRNIDTSTQVIPYAVNVVANFFWQHLSNSLRDRSQVDTYLVQLLGYSFVRDSLSI